MTKQSTSPVPIKKEVNLTFPKAMEAVLGGNGIKIHRIEWGDKGFYGILNNGILMLHKSDGNFYQWIISDGDLFGTDWIIIN